MIEIILWAIFLFIPVSLLIGFWIGRFFGCLEMQGRIQKFMASKKTRSKCPVCGRRVPDK